MNPNVELMEAVEIVNHRGYEILKKNIKLYNAGEQLHNLVDKEKWY